MTREGGRNEKSRRLSFAFLLFRIPKFLLSTTQIADISFVNEKTKSFIHMKQGRVQLLLILKLGSVRKYDILICIP